MDAETAGSLHPGGEVTAPQPKKDLLVDEENTFATTRHLDSERS
jgi:hypothetical protein